MKEKESTLSQAGSEQPAWRTPTVNNLYKAFAKFQAAQEAIKFDADAAINERRKYRYATLTALRESTKKNLTNNGLVVIQRIEPDHVHTILAHESGEEIYSYTPIFLSQSPRNPSQEMGSAITYARRYAYAAILGLVSDEDDDGAAVPKDAKRPAKLTSAIKGQIEKAETRAVLGSIYRKNTGLQENDEFLALLKQRQDHLDAEQASQEPGDNGQLTKELILSNVSEALDLDALVVFTESLQKHWLEDKQIKKAIFDKEKTLIGG